MTDLSPGDGLALPKGGFIALLVRLGSDPADLRYSAGRLGTHGRCYAPDLVLVLLSYRGVTTVVLLTPSF